MDRINKIKLNKKHTILKDGCWNMDIINGIGTCSGYDKCDYIMEILEGTYFDCPTGM